MNVTAPLPDLKPHRITVEELLQFQRSGAFDGLPRMELLDGVLYEMSPQTSAHVVAKNELGFRLRQAVQSLLLECAVLIEPTLCFEDGSAPEPDIAVLKQLRVAGYYPAEMALLAVEVAATSLQTDLNYKRGIYAKAGIPEYWVVDIEGARIHQFWQPDGETYAQTRVQSFEDSLSMITMEGITVETTGLV